MCSGSRFGDHHSIVRLVEVALDRPSFLVHRLDRFTRGVMVLAHGKKIAAALAEQFRDRRVAKAYQARVAGVLSAARTINSPIEGAEAVTHITPVQREDREDRHTPGEDGGQDGGEDGHTLIDIRIETGRKHQIRRHLAEIGHPIVGDAAYGAADPGGLQLAAVALAFDCPVSGERVSYRLAAGLRLF